MAETGQENDDRTEEATPERREEFRKKGQIAVSREITSVFVLFGIVVLISFYLMYMQSDLQDYLKKSFYNLRSHKITPYEFQSHMEDHLLVFLKLTIPFFIVGSVIAISITFFQTKFNFSISRLKPDFKRMNPLTGIMRMFSSQAVVELGKGLGKMSSVALVAYLILYSEWSKVPGIMQYPVVKAWLYWGKITEMLFYSVAGMLLLIAGLDYIYNFMKMEKQLKMTKQEVKEEYKKREADPHIKARMKRMQKDISMAKAVKATQSATVVVTNPTHYAVALKYEIGMTAPIVVAKGKELVAMKMKEVAKDNSVPIVENKPLARTLFKIVKVGQEIPESLYKAVSEIIRYVFMIKNKKI